VTLAELTDVGDTTATAGRLMVADGDSWESAALSGDATLAGSGALSIAANAVALSTDTTGDYVSSATSSQGLTVTGTEGASVGLQDCAANQVLRRNSGDTAWECATGTDVIIWRISNDFSPLSAGTDDLACWYTDRALTLGAVYASLNTQGTTSGTTTIDINEGGTSILGTKLTVDYGESTSATAANAATITDSSIAANAQLCVEVDAISGGATEKGLVITLQATY
jgi:hypothetical protein